VAAAGGITQLTGDGTAGPGSGSQGLTLATVNGNVGTWNNVTINAKGLATAGGNVAYLTSSGVSGMTTGQLAIAGSATTITSSIPQSTFATPAAVTTGDNLRVLKAGDTMTGDLTVNTNITALGLVQSAPTGTGDGLVRSIAAAATNRGLFAAGVPAVGTWYWGLDTDGWWKLSAAATLASPVMQASGSGVMVGAPAGGAKGAGTLNAVGVYAAGVLLTSDANLKTDIEPLPPALPIIAAIEPKTFRWKPGPEPDAAEDPGNKGLPRAFPASITRRLNRGFLAQDVTRVLGGEVEDGVDLGGMVATLWKAVQELQAQLDELRR
jgi:hypothetical protein